MNNLTTIISLLDICHREVYYYHHFNEIVIYWIHTDISKSFYIATGRFICLSYDNPNCLPPGTICFSVLARHQYHMPIGIESPFAEKLFYCGKD